VLEQRLTAELGEHVDRIESGVNEVAEDEIDDPVFAAEGNRRLDAFPSEGKSWVPLPPASMMPNTLTFRVSSTAKTGSCPATLFGNRCS